MSEISDELLKMIKAEKGRLIQRLISQSDLETRTLYETKGRITALTYVIQLLEDGPQDEVDEEKVSLYSSIAEASEEAFEKRAEEARNSQKNSPVDIGQEVQ